MTIKTEILSKPDIPQAVRVLASAFSDNPAYLWAFKPRPERDHNFHWFMERVLAVNLLNGLALKTDGTHAVALWFEPGKSIGWLELLQAGLYELPFKLGLETYLRIQQILNQNRKWMTNIMGQTKHYYLFHLAVEPSYQGTGLGGSLIRAITERADTEQVPCFLETDRRRNIPLYEKHGFVIRGTANLAPNVPLWYMRRDPISLSVI